MPTGDALFPQVSLSLLLRIVAFPLFFFETQARDSVAEKQKAVGEKEITAQQSSKVILKKDFLEICLGVLLESV